MALFRTLGVAGTPVWQWYDSATGTREGMSFEEGLGRLAQTRNAAGDFPDEPCLPPFGGTKILCVGRNYRPHAEELGNPIPLEPLWFSKPPSSLLGHRGTIMLPSGVGRIDYEGELALIIGRLGKHIPAREALDCVAGITIALDITARELQKKDGQWTRAKGFDTFCPLGPAILPFHPGWLEAELTTELNGTVVQRDRLSSLIFPVPQLIEHLSACMTLMPGDVLLTGTPAGVGPVVNGDRVNCSLRGPGGLELAVTVAG